MYDFKFSKNGEYVEFCNRKKLELKDILQDFTLHPIILEGKTILAVKYPRHTFDITELVELGRDLHNLLTPSDTSVALLPKDIDIEAMTMDELVRLRDNINEFIEEKKGEENEKV